MKATFKLEEADCPLLWIGAGAGAVSCSYPPPPFISADDGPAEGAATAALDDCGAAGEEAMDWAAIDVVLDWPPREAVTADCEEGGGEDGEEAMAFLEPRSEVSSP
jgi:hypothetical protein